MKNLLRSFLALVLGSALALSAADSAPKHADLDQAKAAFFSAWTKKAGETFTTAKLSEIIDGTDDFLSFDGMSQGKTVIGGWNVYAGIWGPGMNGFTVASLSEAKPVRTWVSGDLAVTASIARIYGEMPNNQKLDVLGHLTLTWKKTGGKWKVVHEHMSLGVKE